MNKGPLHIKLEHLTVQLDGKSVLEDISATIPANSLTAIIGPNGSGKTTLLKAILGLVDYRGKIRFCDDADCDCQPVIGYFPQRFDFDRHAPLTAGEFMVMDQQQLPLWMGVDSRLKQSAIDQLT